VNVYYKPIWCSQVTKRVKIANSIVMCIRKPVHPPLLVSSSPNITHHHPNKTSSSSTAIPPLSPQNQSMEVQPATSSSRDDQSAEHNKNCVARWITEHSNICVARWNIDANNNCIAQWNNPCSSTSFYCATMID